MIALLQISANCDCERISKIDQHLMKLCLKYSRLFFFRTRCSFTPKCNGLFFPPSCEFKALKHYYSFSFTHFQFYFHKSSTQKCFGRFIYRKTHGHSMSGKLHGSVKKSNKKAVLSQRWPRNALYIMGALKISGTPWLRPRPLFPTFSCAFVPIDPMNVPTKFEVRSFTRTLYPYVR